VFCAYVPQYTINEYITVRHVVFGNHAEMVAICELYNLCNKCLAFRLSFQWPVYTIICIFVQKNEIIYEVLWSVSSQSRENIITTVKTAINSIGTIIQAVPSVQYGQYFRLCTSTKIICNNQLIYFNVKMLILVCGITVNHKIIKYCIRRIRLMSATKSPSSRT
jgi:hypothetical protein